MRAAALILSMLATLAVAAQQQFPTLEKGFQAEKLYHFGDVDSVNVFSGVLLINIGIGPEYQLDGGLSYQLRLSYNSKPWDFEQAGTKVHATPSRRASAGFGWILGMGRYVPFNDPANGSGLDLYESPDGGDHRFDGPSGIVTSDGSNLRILSPTSNERRIEFPDGTVKRFLRNTAGQWNLTQILRAGSSDAVNILYNPPLTTACPAGTSSLWVITDTKNRGTTVCFTNLLVDSVSRPMVSRVVLASPGGTATYAFHYTATTVSKPVEDTDSDSSNWRQSHDIQVLDSLTLPDATKYEFTLGGNANIGSMTLPTGGKITYAYDSWNVPATDICSNTYGLGFGFGGAGYGVRFRTFTPAVPAGQTPVTRTWQYERQLGPQPSYISQRQCLVQTGIGTDPELHHVELYDELIATVTDPAGHKTVQYFSVWPGDLTDETPSPTGVLPIHHGLPYGRYDSAQNRYRSQEFFDCTGTCVLKRSLWVRREPEPRFFDPNGGSPPVPTRLASQRTIFHDDPVGCASEGAQPTCARTTTDWSDWDNYGHYRTVKTTTKFHSDTDQRVVTTAWNKVGGLARTIGTGDPWVLNTYESVTTTEAGVTAIEQACFDLPTGFLRGRRTLGGTSPAGTDLLVMYERNTAGNTAAESFYGGDVHPITANHSLLCSALDALSGTPDYRISHIWENGYPVRSQYDDVPFPFRDLTISPHGLVLSARDAAQRETVFGYDSSWRLTSVTPPGEASTTYSYSAAAVSNATTLTQPATVVETTQSATAGGVQRRYQYDAFGRLWRQLQLMPDGEWNVRETLYDALERKASVSEPESLEGVANELAFHPSHRTTFSYDAFGRTTQTTSPDGKVASMAFTGARTTTRSIEVADAEGGARVVRKREEMDGLGRLVSVTESLDQEPQTTTYSYEIGGKLAAVSMPSDAGTQTRSFTYDKRGLLTQEQHPELGATGYGTSTYSLYDARGHAGKKTMGAIDLRYEFDRGERLIRIRDGAQGNRDLSLFAWDCIRFEVTAPCETLTHAGQLAASARFNYTPDLGTIAVTQANQYSAATGRLVRRDSAVGDGVVSGTTRFNGEAFFFTQNHNDLGMLDSLTYPCRVGPNGCISGGTGRTIALGYTNGALSSVGSWATSMTYQPNGMIDTITHGAGSAAVRETWTADPSGMARPYRIQSTNASGTQLWTSGEYTFDGVGNVASIGSTSYGYDAFGRLTAWKTTGPNGSYTSTNRQYDAYGNYLATMEKGCGSGPDPLCFSSGVVFRTLRGTTNHYEDLTYDDAGNVLRDFAARTYTWDPLGMMTGVTADGHAFRYLYSADEERIAAVERVPVSSELRNLTTFTLRGDANQLLSTWTDDWTGGSRVMVRKEDTIWRGSQLLARAANTNTHYSLDHLGSPRLITNSSGATVHQQTFDPFGSGGLLGSGALQFTAHERDRANLGHGNIPLPDYMHARYYDTGDGRFLSVDPGRDWDIRQPQSWNMYSYVRNNPLRYVDPTGRATGDTTEDKDKPKPKPEPKPEPAPQPKPEPQPHPVGPDGKPLPPPVPLPDGKNGRPNQWVPVINPSPRPGQRPVKWKPQYPVPSPTGAQPSGSWDPEGHYDIDIPNTTGGPGDRDRVLPDGTRLGPHHQPISSMIEFNTRIPGYVVAGAGAYLGYVTYMWDRWLAPCRCRGN